MDLADLPAERTMDPRNGNARHAEGTRHVASTTDQEMEAFDALPPRLRGALCAAAQDISALDAYQSFWQARRQGVPVRAMETFMIQQIMQMEADELRRFNSLATQAGVSVQRPDYGIARTRRKRR